MGDNTGRRRATAAMEAESREWLVRCPACGHERSIWEMGGIRYKARGTKRIFRRCPACHQVGWHLVYRERDGVQLPPLRPARPLGWYIGAFAAILLIFVGLLVGFLVSLFLFLGRASADRRGPTSSYSAPLVARDRAGAHGSTNGFRVTRFSSKNGRTPGSCTPRRRDGPIELQMGWLNREDGARMIASNP